MSSLSGSWQALFIVALLGGCSDSHNEGATSQGGNAAAAGAASAGSPSGGNAMSGSSTSGRTNAPSGGSNAGGMGGMGGNQAGSGTAGSDITGTSGAAVGGAGASTGGTSDGGTGGMGGMGGQLGNVFKDPFDAFDENVWSCEYSCPTVTGGNANFHLLSGVAPDNEGSWSKIRYKPRRFTSGRFTVRFALTNRPTQAVWWGIALWDDGPSPDGSEFNEINFGYTTDESFPNTQLRFESSKHGKGTSLKVDTGVDLYDGSFHTGTLEYDATHVAFYFDGTLLKTITDTTVVPTDPMDFIIGPRLVSGSASLTNDFSELADSTQIEW